MPGEETYKLLFDKNPLPMWVICAESLSVLAANDAAVAKYGWSREEFLKMTIFDMRPSEELEPLKKSLERLSPQLHGDKLFTAGVFRHLRKDGQAFDVEITVSPIAFQGKAAWISMAQDITDRLKAQEAQGQIEKLEAVSRLASQVAHDFNNLLTAIAGYAELLFMSFDGGDARREDADEIRKAVGRATEMTQQLLSFSRPARAKLAPTDLNTPVAAAQGKLKEALGPKVELSLSLGKDLPKVSADPEQVEKALLLLAANAREAMSQGGRLQIETRAAAAKNGKARVELSLRDSGAGMDKAVLARLGEPYFTTKEKGKGMGLGLPTVFSIVRQASAEIQIDSEPGKGTTVRLTFLQA